MEPTSPEFLSVRLVELLAQEDLDEIANLYEDGALFIELDGVSSGATAIRSAHRRFLDSGLTLELVDSIAFQVGDLALVHWTWTVTDRDGVSTSGDSSEVVRRQPDGSWKFVIDNSDGAKVIGLV